MSTTGPPVEHVRGLSHRRIPRVFAHFFDTHFLREKAVELFRGAALSEMRLAIRFAVLLADEIYVPASFYWESDFCRTVMSEYDPETFSGQIFFVGSGASADEFVEEKLYQYPAHQPAGALYRHVDRSLPLPWRTRFGSATRDISAEWAQRVQADGLDAVRRNAFGAVPKDFDKRILEVPERLARFAFIVPNVVPILFDKDEVPLAVENSLHSIINSAYFRSYAVELDAAVIQEMNYLASPVRVPSGDPEHDIDFRGLQRACRARAVLRDIMRATGTDLLRMRDDERFIDAQLSALADTVQSERERFYGVSSIGIRGMRSETREAPADACRMLVVTGLPEETSAMLAMFDSSEVVGGGQGDGNIYHLGELSLGGGAPRAVLLATASDMGKVNAAVLTTNAIRSFPAIHHILLVGIAGGCPNPAEPAEHVRLGDIVVSDHHGIFEYDDIKLTEAGAERRGPRERPSHPMLQAFQALRARASLGARPWEEHIRQGLSRLERAESDFSRPDSATDILYRGDEVIPHPVDPHRQEGLPRVHGGGIGTADILLREPSLRDELRDKYGIKAVEMEGSGVQGAGWASGRDVLIVRGISDYCDTHKADRWRYAAALAAAAFARSMIEILPEEWFS